jgi:hypothetical protein
MRRYHPLLVGVPYRHMPTTGVKGGLRRKNTAKKQKKTATARNQAQGAKPQKELERLKRPARRLAEWSF